MLRGVQTVMASLHSAILLISTPPVNWRPEKASSLGGVIVVPENVTPEDLEDPAQPQPALPDFHRV